MQNLTLITCIDTAYAATILYTTWQHWIADNNYIAHIRIILATRLA